LFRFDDGKIAGDVSRLFWQQQEGWCLPWLKILPVDDINPPNRFEVSLIVGQAAQQRERAVHWAVELEDTGIFKKLCGCNIPATPVRLPMPWMATNS
jgi:hypothetical protein